MSLIYLLVLIAILGLLYWLVGSLGLPQPFLKIAQVILIIALVLILINFLLGIAGHGVITIR